MAKPACSHDQVRINAPALARWMACIQDQGRIDGHASAKNACIKDQGRINGHALVESISMHPDPRQNQWACTGQINGHASRSKAKSMGMHWPDQWAYIQIQGKINGHALARSMGMHPDPRQNQWACIQIQGRINGHALAKPACGQGRGRTNQRQHNIRCALSCSIYTHVHVCTLVGRNLGTGTCYETTRNGGQRQGHGHLL